MENNNQITNTTKSRLALKLAGIYILICVILHIYALVCDGFGCGLLASSISTFFPWNFPPFQYLSKSLMDILHGDFFQVTMILQLINAAIIYLIGLGISKIIKKN